MASFYRSAVVASRQIEQRYAAPWRVPQLRRWALALLVVSALVLASLTQLTYAKKITVHGVVQPTSKPLVVRSSSTGSIAGIFVEEGAQVVAGAALVQIDQRSFAANGVPHERLHLDQLRSQHAALSRQKILSAQLSNEQLLALRAQVSAYRARQKILDKQQSLALQREVMVAADHHRIEALASADHVSKRDLHQAGRVYLLAQEAGLELQSRRQAAAQNSLDLAARIKVLMLEKDHAQAEASAALQQLDYEIARLSAKSQRTVVAALSGRISDVLVRQGQQVSPGMAMVSVVPPNSGLPDIDLYLPSTAVGRIRLGLTARVRFAGFPYAEYGLGKGEISDVSAVNLADGPEPVFRARVTLVSMPQGIDDLPSGMQVEVDVILHNAPLWQWLLHPMADVAVRL